MRAGFCYGRYRMLIMSMSDDKRRREKTNEPGTDTARIYADAGANYVFADDEHSGSVPLAFETVFDKGQNADFWLIKYNQAIDKTYKELEQDYAPYTGFRAFKERNIYGCNTGKVDFYEDSPFHPDRLLKDLIKIFHPTLLEGYELKYFTKLAE